MSVWIYVCTHVLVDVLGSFLGAAVIIFSRQGLLLIEKYLIRLG